MAEQEEEKQKLIDRLKHTYRLVIMNNETFEEVGSYKLTLLNVYVGLSSILVMLTLIVVLLVAFTPLKQYLPGYDQAFSEREIVRMTLELDSLKVSIGEYEKYYEDFSRIVMNNVDTSSRDTIYEAYVQTELNPNQGLSANGELSEEELEIRREVELSEIGEMAREATISKIAPDRNLSQYYFVPPVRGPISAAFDADKGHNGVDVLAPKETVIKSALDGYVIFSDWTIETGASIGVWHGGGVITFYKHNSVLFKEVGDVVTAGEALAVIGNSGTLTSGPHLHFELWYRGKPINPEDYIDF